MLTKRIQLDEKYENVYLDIYVANPMDHFVRDAILILPGGGYKNLSPREGEPIALAFMAQGYNAFVLNYSVIHQKHFPGQLIEASLAMAHIKDHAEEYNINPERVFVTGFSAGGHLAGSLGILWHLPEIYEATGMEYGYNKPAGMMLGYPVISSDKAFGHIGSFQNLFGTDVSPEVYQQASLEMLVDEKSVPLYIMHTANDAVVPVRNALVLAEAYAKLGKPFEMHIYPDAPHGIALANEITAHGEKQKLVRPQIERWVQDAAIWAKNL